VDIRSSCGGFTPAPTPPTPTPPPVPATVYANYGDCATGGLDIITTVSGPGGTTFPNVIKVSGICYSYQNLGGTSGPVYTNFDSFSDCASCQAAPTPTPPTPPTPTPASCFAINNIGRDTTSGNNACLAARRETNYFDTGTLCTATAWYGTSNTCSSLHPNAVYISDGAYARYWNGTSFTSCTGCP